MLLSRQGALCRHLVEGTADQRQRLPVQVATRREGLAKVRSKYASTFKRRGPVAKGPGDFAPEANIRNKGSL